MQPQYNNQAPPRHAHSQPLHHSFIAGNQQPAPFKPLSVINQETVVQPQKQQSVMYKSTIQPMTSTASPGGFAGSSFASMGRTVRQESKDLKTLTENTAVISSQKPQPLTFRAEKSERPKMASSVIFFNKTAGESFNRFQPQSLQNSSHSKGSALTGLDYLTSKARCVQEQEVNDSLDERKPQVSQMEEHRKNREMFKSSIEGQSKMSSTFSFSQMAYEKSNQNTGPKKWQLNRNTPSKKDTNFVKEKVEQKGAQETAPNKGSIQTNTMTPKVEEKAIPESSMFKKKNPYKQQSYSGKTDQNLLKMLGINQNGGLKSPSSAAKASEDLKGVTKELFKPSINEKQMVEVKKEVSPQQPDIKKFSKEDFKIGKKMGKGQFGEVMLVQHKLTGFICGMKTMSKKQIKSQKYDNQIARQLSIQFYLQHRHVTPLYGYFQDTQNVYLLIEFCTDGQLLQKLRKDRRMQEEDVSPIIRQICQGLDYVHKEQIIHRDIKPENILFNFGTVKISDFGWAVHCGTGMRKTISGSPLYYSPEIVQETSYDQKIDIWSIGMMTYECLLGKIPFRIYSELDLNRIVSDQIQFPDYVDVTPEAKDFILKIMKKKPQERIEMRQILRHPFITKYAKDRKVSSEVLDEFRRVVRV